MLTKKAKKGHYVVEYINGVDGAYIDLDYIPKDNTKLVCEAKFNVAVNVLSTWGAITNVGGASQYQRFHWGYQNGNLVIAWNNGGIFVGERNDLNYHIFTVSKDFVQIDSNSHAANLNMPNLSLWIFSRNADFQNTNVYCDSYCKYVQIFEDDVLVRDYIPILKDGQYGLFETIQQKYYFNAAETGYITGEEVQIEQYDLEWDYTMGMPEDNGFEKYCQGVPDSYEMTDNGLKVKISSNQYVRLNPLESSLQFCNEGILEIKVNIVTIYSGGQNGLRVILSDGEGGCHIQIRNWSGNTMFYNTGQNVHVPIANVKLRENTDYTIRIERKQGMSYVYVDNQQVYSTDVKSMGYAQYNRIFFQSGGQYILKSIKFKKIS